MFILSGTPIARKRVATGIALPGLAVLMLSVSAPPAHAFSVSSFAWFADSTPNFQLSDVPAGHGQSALCHEGPDKPDFHHGGGTVGYRGQPEVPCDAFASGFVGPSPPPGEVHTYEFTIQALAPDGHVLGATTARRRFPE